MENYIQTLLNSCSRASVVSRRIVVVLIASVAYVFTATWSGVNNWEDPTKKMLRCALITAQYDIAHPPSFIDPLRKEKQATGNIEEEKALNKVIKLKSEEKAKELLNQINSTQTIKFDHSTLSSAIFWLATYPSLLTPTDIQKRIDDIKSSGSQAGDVELPLFGIHINPNDITFYSGVLFVTILLCLCFFLYREEYALKIFTRQLPAGTKLQYYNSLASEQVLTFPHEFIGKQIRRSTWESIASILAKLLFILPFLAISYSVKSDYDTIENGWMISMEHTRLNTNAGIVLILLVLLFSTLCIYFSVRVDNQWRILAKEVAEDQPVTASQDE